MCSDNTKDLGKLYLNTRVYNSGDTTIENMYPLLDRIVEWMDDFYDKEAEKEEEVDLFWGANFDSYQHHS